MKIEVLYFEGCPNHPPAVELMRAVAAELGVSTEIEAVEVTGQADVERLRFLGSPTIQVNGIDVEPAARSRTDYSYSCRTYDGKGLPDRDTVVSALREATTTGQCEPEGCREQSSAASEQPAPGERMGLVAAGGSVLSAALASACCWLPLLLLALGVSAGGASAWFEKYRVPFLALTGVLLAAGFYVAYLRKPVCAPGSACAAPHPKLRRLNRVTIWVATVFVVAFAFFPNYVGYVIASETPSETVGADTETIPVTLRIEGMTCEACAVVVRDALMKVPGVQSARVSYAAGETVVNVGGATAPPTESLVQAVERAGYKAIPKETNP